MKILIFGDSITQGYWDTEGGWVNRLRKYYDELQVKDFDQDQPTIFNLGISGDDSQDILDRAETEIKARTRHDIPPVVIVQVGVNDSCAEPTLNRVPIETYRSNLEKLVGQIQSISSKVVFVGLSACDETKTTPVSWGEYYYANQSIKAYENQMRSVAEAANIPFVPVFDEFTKAMQDRELLADGLHPNNDGHGLIFDIVSPHLLKIFSAIR